MDFSTFFDYPQMDAEQSSPISLFLPALSQRDWSKILQYTETLRYQPGEIVLATGSQERSLYIIAFGRFEMDGSQKGKRPKTFLEAGAVLGEQTFLDGQPQPVEVQATTEGELIRLSLDSFETLAAHQPELARAILFDLGRILSLRFRIQSEQSL